MSSSSYPGVYRFACGVGKRTQNSVAAGTAEMSPSRMPRFRNIASTASSSVGLGVPETAESNFNKHVQQTSPESNGAASSSDDSSTCRCQRPQSLIMCSSCGFTFTGRVRSHCHVHPSQIFLMDNESCPGCSSTSLKEYRKD